MYLYPIHAIRATDLWFHDSRLQLAVSRTLTRIACRHKPHSVQFTPPTPLVCNPRRSAGLPRSLDAPGNSRRIFDLKEKKVFGSDSKIWQALDLIGNSYRKLLRVLSKLCFSSKQSSLNTSRNMKQFWTSRLSPLGLWVYSNFSVPG